MLSATFHYGECCAGRGSAGGSSVGELELFADRRGERMAGCSQTVQITFDARSFRAVSLGKLQEKKRGSAAGVVWGDGV